MMKWKSYNKLNTKKVLLLIFPPHVRRIRIEVVTLTHLPIDQVEVPIGLIAQLSYYQESKNSNSQKM